MRIFLDSSALVKRYIEEQGTEEVIKINAYRVNSENYDIISSDKRGFSALSLSKEMRVSYWVACTILQKIRTTMGQQDNKYKLEGLVEMDEAYFGGERKGGKWGRGTTKSKVLVAISTPACANCEPTTYSELTQ